MPLLLKKTKSKTIFHSFVIGVVVKVVSLPLSMICGILLARILGKEIYGTYIFVLSLSTFVCSGVNRSAAVLVVRQLAVDSETGRISNKFNAIVTWIVLLMVLCLTMTYLVASAVDYRYKEETLVLIILMLILYFQASILRGMSLVSYAIFIELVSRPLVQVFLLGFWYVHIQKFPPTDDQYKVAMYLLVASLLVACVFSGMIGIRKIRLLKNHFEGFFGDRRWLLSSVSALLALGYLQGLYVQLPVFILGAKSLNEDISDYRVAASLASVMTVVIVAVNYVVAPKISKMAKNGRYRDIESLLRYSSLCMFLPALLLGSILFGFGEAALLLLFGAEYANASSVLYIICLTHVVNSFFGPVMVVMNMLGKESVSLYAVAVSVLITYGFGQSVVATHGALGVSVAVLIGVIVYNIILAVSLHRIYGINCIPKLVPRM